MGREPDQEDDLLNAVRARVRSERAAEASGSRGVLRVALREDVSEVEGVLGWALDPFLRRVYEEVADGGVGPGYGTLALHGPESMLGHYESLRLAGLPDGLVPVWSWGGAIFSCVDRLGRVVTRDGDQLALTEFTPRTWLTAWVSGKDMWRAIFDDQTVTIVNPFTRQPMPTKIRGTLIGARWSLA